METFLRRGPHAPFAGPSWGAWADFGGGFAPHRRQVSMKGKSVARLCPQEAALAALLGFGSKRDSST